MFDAKRVSFVSATQAFNTTTSMGRLTLNVLLSFAQFEREVTKTRSCERAQPFNKSLNASRTTLSRVVPDTLPSVESWYRYCWMKS